MVGRNLAKPALLALLGVLVVGATQAQTRRMPVRTQEVPDTESGRPAASAEKPTFKGRLLIYGPQSLPVTPPPEHVKPVPPEAAPVAAPAPAPAPVIAAPAPVISAPKPEPAPVVTPVPAPPPPVAAPIPATPPPVAKPEPVPASVPVAKPAPAPAPVPVAKPEAVPEPPAAKPVAPPPVAAPTPAPAPAPVAAAPPPAPVVAAPAPVREPVVRIETPKPAPPAAPPRQDVALAAPSSSATPTAPVPIEMKVIESIFTCLAPGLPQDWSKAWVEITDAGAGKEKTSKFFFSTLRGDRDGEPLVPCNAQELTRRIIGLNDKLPADRRAWSRALLVIDSDGEYELSYEYPK